MEEVLTGAKHEGEQEFLHDLAMRIQSHRPALISRIDCVCSRIRKSGYIQMLDRTIHVNTSNLGHVMSHLKGK